MVRGEYRPKIEPLVWIVVIFTAIMIVVDIKRHNSRPKTTEQVARATSR